MENLYYLEKAICSLSKNDKKRFKKFLNSGFFKKRHCRNNDIMKYYDILLNCKDDIPTELIAEKIIIQMYPDAAVNSKKIHKKIIKIRSDLLSYLYDYFSVEQFFKNNLNVTACRMELRSRKLFDLIEHHVLLKNI